MFTNGYKSHIGQPFQCWCCNGIFTRIADDDDEICNRCLEEYEEGEE